MFVQPYLIFFWETKNIKSLNNNKKCILIRLWHFCEYSQFFSLQNILPLLWSNNNPCIQWHGSVNFSVPWVVTNRSMKGELEKIGKKWQIIIPSVLSVGVLVVSLFVWWDAFYFSCYSDAIWGRKILQILISTPQTQNSFNS